MGGRKIRYATQMRFSDGLKPKLLKPKLVKGTAKRSPKMSRLVEKLQISTKSPYFEWSLD